VRYRFDKFSIDLHSQELYRGDQPLAIEPQVYALLAYFVMHPGKLIDHDELIQAVWQGRIVSDSAIAARISAARRVIGDSGKAQRLIKTVARRGFRFLAEVEELAGKGAAEVAAGVATTEFVQSRHDHHQSIRFCQSADGTRLAHALTGSGPQLVRTGHWLTHLEHDWNSPIWRPFLDRLGKQYEVLRYDQRGCGLSDHDIGDFSFQRFVEDLETVIDSAARDRFILYASSQGVPIAIDYACRHPERVSHLILHGGYARGRLVRHHQTDVEQGEAILKLIEHGWGVSGSPFLQAFTTMYIPDGNREQIDSLVKLQRLTTTTRNAVAIRRAVDSFDVSDQLARITTKALVMHAAHDGVQPVDQGRNLAAGIRASEFVLLDSANHVLVPQEPAWERFFRELQRFTAS
jgi:DNA-binding winged helix-turn-helix (wHTH) protein/pimeloyl-ACP methyl ester carboxylesterase